MSLESATQKLVEKVESASASLDSTVKFNLGEGVIFLEGETVSNEDKDADCTVTMEMDDFISMMDGDLNPTSAFMGGQMTIDGDMGIAMQLSSLLS